jgi:hypothetical protein
LPPKQKNKCPCCKFNRCFEEFRKHKSWDSTLALERQIKVASDFVAAAKADRADEYLGKICPEHLKNVAEYFSRVVDAIEIIKVGVRLPKIKST